jgi:galactokinase
MNATPIKAKFEILFKGLTPQLYCAPGRVNLIGEHTDYNEGFVLPAAIDKDIVFAIAINGTEIISLYSYDLNEVFEINVNEVSKTKVQWANYLLGVVAQFQKAGHQLTGFSCVFGGDVPSGAGLSSSAAVECGLAFALNDLFALKVEKFTLTKMAQKAEHEYAGVMCGIMDQFASMFGKENHVVRLDCRSLDYEYFPFDMSDYKIVLCDTNVKHSLASSEYNNRRAECEAGVSLLQKYYPDIKSLRDVTVEILEKHKAEFNPTTYKRCLYVVNENNRVEEGCHLLKKGDLAAFGRLMYASHEGLQHDYAVSCKELDFLVDKTRNMSEVLGARMMGGGFGGCTINLVKVSEVDKFVDKMTESYKTELGLTLKTYITSIKNGARAI